MASELFNKLIDEVSKEDAARVKSYLDTMDAFHQRSNDMRLLIAAKLSDKCTDRIAVCEQLYINLEELNNWLNGAHDFTLFDIARIEKFLGEKILKL